MIHLFDIEKEEKISALKESMKDGLINIGPVKISIEQTKSVGFQSYYLDQYSLRDKKNHDIDNTDSFPLNDTFDRKTFKNLSLQDGFFQENLSDKVLKNNRLFALGKSDLQTEITNNGPELFHTRTISDITSGTTTQIESVGHDLMEGDVLYIEGVVGMTEINRQFGVVISVVDDDNVMVNIDSSSFTSYTSGGTLKFPVHLIHSIQTGSITQVETHHDHDFSINDTVIFYGVSGCNKINGMQGKVTEILSSTVLKVDIDSSQFSSYRTQLVSMTDSNFNSYNFYYGGYISKMLNVGNEYGNYGAWANRLSSKYVYDFEDEKVITHNEDYSSPTTRYFWNFASLEERKLSMKFYEFFSNFDHSGETQHQFDFQEYDYYLNTPEDFIDFKNRIDEDPELYSWLKNKKESGYKSIRYDVQEVFYSDDNVFIQSTGIPEYLTTIDAWKPSVINQMWSFEIPRTLTTKTDKTSTRFGSIGVLINGVPLFNFKNGQSFKGLKIWNDNTVISLKSLYDNHNGIVTPNGEYVHTHSPISLYDELNTTEHSPLLGYALDGCPIYGPYGYTDYAPEDSTSDVSRVVSGYTLRNIKERTTLPDGTVLAVPNYGPVVPVYDYNVTVATTQNLYFTYANNQGNNATLTNRINGNTIIDNITINIGDNVLIKNQNNPLENGVYQVILTGPSSRTTLRRIRIHDEAVIKSNQKGNYNEADYGYNQRNGNKVLVLSGRINGNTSWILTGGQRIGISSITASKFDAYPLGYFVEDFEYSGNGTTTLDEYNGRYGRTPEYPDGVYAYFMTINPNTTPAYPYAVGEKYYGYVPQLSLRNAGHSKIYDTVKNYIDKVVGLKIQILQNDKLYELVSLTPETWEENFSKSSSFGMKNKNFFYNKSIGLDSFATPELLKSLDFELGLDESLEFSGNIQTIATNTYENTTVDDLRSATRIDPIFNSTTKTWSDTATGYRTYVASDSYDYDVSNINTYVSRRLDSAGESNPLTIEMYSTIVIDVPATSVFNTYFNQNNWGGSMILDWEIFTVPYGFGSQPFGEEPYGGE